MLPDVFKRDQDDDMYRGEHWGSPGIDRGAELGASKFEVHPVLCMVFQIYHHALSPIF